MQIPKSPTLAMALKRLFGTHSEAEVMATMLSEYVRSDGDIMPAPYGLFLTDFGPSTLSRLIQAEVIPILRQAGTKVAFCDLSETSIVDATSLVQDALSTFSEFPQPVGRIRFTRSSRRHVGVHSVDEAQKNAAARMILSVVDHRAWDVIFVINRVERLLSNIEGRSLLAGLQAVRELLAAREGAASHFLLVGISTDDAVLDQLAIGSFKPARRRLIT